MIYCVDDEESIRELEVYALRAAGFEAEGFADGESFEKALAETKPELVLLDIMMPGRDGMEILDRLRKSAATRNVPVIMATAKGAEYEKVAALDRGADDYLAKPFGMMEMVSRVRAVLRRCRPGADEALCVRNIVLSSREHAVLAGGKAVDLTAKEFSLLRILMENRGLVCSRDMLFAEVWGQDWFGETRTLDAHMHTLRRKLGASGDAIETVRGLGYRIMPDC